MSIKLSQINKPELEDFVDKRILKRSSLDILNDINLEGVQEGNVLAFVGSPPSWTTEPMPQIPRFTEDGLKVVAGSPPTKELLAVDDTVARRNTRNRFTHPVGGRTNAPIIFASGAPGYIFNEVGANIDESSWRFFASSGNLYFDVRNDANNLSKSWLTVERTGVDISRINLEAKQVTVNDDEVVTRAEFEAVVNELRAEIEALNSAE